MMIINGKKLKNVLINLHLEVALCDGNEVETAKYAGEKIAASNLSSNQYLRIITTCLSKIRELTNSLDFGILAEYKK